ncbi:MAG: flavodoxin family protein [Planctomycetes bacterium]|nr:flavodoxin family protein [Planctomycetota bacterium]MBL7145229.1 flavodoxin family protein [Phycisphaerae bacterium]
MKVTIFNGSPRGKKGNTHVMVKEFSKGAGQAGAEVENVFLVKKKIRPCRGCFTCWIKTPGKCIIKDDMAELIQKFGESDIVVFATPVYVDNVTGIMKNFMDRLIAGLDPHFEKDEGGECVHISRSEKQTKLVVISNCGFPEQSHFQVLELLFKRVARNMRSEVIGEIYRSGGGILREAPLILKPVISKYKKLLQTAGMEIVEKQRLSEETRLRLEKPFISDEQYIAAANERFDALLANV